MVRGVSRPPSTPSPPVGFLFPTALPLPPGSSRLSQHLPPVLPPVRIPSLPLSSQGRSPRSSLQHCPCGSVPCRHRPPGLFPPQGWSTLPLLLPHPAVLSLVPLPSPRVTSYVPQYSFSARIVLILVPLPSTVCLSLFSTPSPIFS